MTFFTPGPWKYDKNTERIHGERFTLVAWCKPHAGNPDATHANGNLIAAAPELYEALKELHDLVEEMLIGAYKPDGFTLQPARMALSKVRDSTYYRVNPDGTVTDLKGNVDMGQEYGKIERTLPAVDINRTLPIKPKEAK